MTERKTSKNGVGVMRIVVTQKRKQLAQEIATCLQQNSARVGESARSCTRSRTESHTEKSANGSRAESHAEIYIGSRAESNSRPVGAAENFSVVAAPLTDYKKENFQLPATFPDWVFFTSARSFEYLDKAQIAQLQSLAARGSRYGVVGEKTAAALQNIGITCALTPAANARALLGVLSQQLVEDTSAAVQNPPCAWILGSKQAKPTLLAGVQKFGMKVEKVAIYSPYSLPCLAEDFYDADIVVVTAGSAAVAYAQLTAVARVRPAPIIALGEQSAQDAQRAGLEVIGVAARPTAADIAKLILKIDLENSRK